MAQDAAPAYPIESVDRALLLLSALEEREGLDIAEVTEMLNVSRSTAYRLLGILQRRGFVRHDPERRAHVGGPALLRIGLAAVRRLDVAGALRPVLEGVVESTGETAHTVVLQGSQVAFIDCVQGRHMIRAADRTGSTLPAHCSAGGKALLALLSRDRVRAQLPARLRGLTARSITSIPALEHELDEVRRRGYALNTGESEEDLHAVAIAVPEPLGRGSIDAAVTVSGPALRMDPARLERLQAVIRAQCTALGLLRADRAAKA
ncbi:MAG TPA: IclR family transcriptional regulator [Solirubrobacteraceae bacterium]|nr:IclR family transcriptional regulator [Solirubrobacteraceae bacterium]